MASELLYQATYRMRTAPEDVRSAVLRVPRSSAGQAEHDAEALRRAHAVEWSAPERELVRVVRIASDGSEPAADVLFEAGREL